MPIESITLDGRRGTIVYLDADWHPVSAAVATMARVLFDDGGTAFFDVGFAAQKREYVRDPDGRFAEVFHGTTEDRLQSILKEGLTLAHAGEMWPGLSREDSVYLTTNEKEAVVWAEGAAQRALRPRWDAREAQRNNPDPTLTRDYSPIVPAAAVILTVQIPSDHEANLTPDINIDADPFEAEAWQFKGPIPPEWIVGAKIGRLKHPDRVGETLTWDEVPLKKAAAESQTIYVVLLLDEQGEVIQKFDENQLRDEKGRWTKGGKAGARVTDTGRTFLHGTAQGFLEDILREGITGEHGGRIHPTDKRGRTLALPGHVYMTTDLAEAKKYAQSAGLSDEFFTKDKETYLNPVYMKGVPRDEGSMAFYESGTEIGGGLPAVVTIELPPSIVKKLRKDRRSDILTPDPYDPEGGHMYGGKVVYSDYARSYKGDIKPEWITSISYMTKDVATGEETWHTIAAKDYKKPGPTTPPWLPAPPGWPTPEQWLKERGDEDEVYDAAGKKVASEGLTFYIPLQIPLQPIAEKFDEAKHPRDEEGQFTASGRRARREPSEQALRDMQAFGRRAELISKHWKQESERVTAAYQAWMAETQAHKPKPLKFEGAASKKLASYKEAQRLDAEFSAHNEVRRRAYAALTTQALARLAVPEDQRSPLTLQPRFKQMPLPTVTVTMAKQALAVFKQADGSGAFIPYTYPAEMESKMRELGINVVKNPDGSVSLPSSLFLENSREVGGGNRAHATVAGIAITANDNATTVYHELAHHIELNERAVLQAAVALRASLAAPKDGEATFALPGKPGDPVETALHGNFPDPYSARVYPDNLATEMVSTGVAAYLTDPVTFAKDRPEHFRFIYDVMHGKYRTSKELGAAA